MELLEELQVVLEHQADVVDAVLQHGDTLDADAESEAGVLVRVDVAVLEDFAVDDAAAQHLDPAGVLAQRAALAVALKAAHVHLHAGLGEREVGGTQAGAGVGTEHLLHEGVQSALQIAQRDALIHDQTFHLVEHGAVGSVRVGAEHTAGHQDLDGRLLNVHGADLAAGSLGTQQELLRQVEGVLHVARRMFGREVECREDVPVVLDFGPFQLVVNGQEIINGYSELVDAREQEARLIEQSRLKANGDEEAMSIDNEYIKAMEYGMPPISGWGLGVDRFLQFLTNSDNIRDVVLYPLMRPRDME